MKNNLFFVFLMLLCIFSCNPEFQSEDFTATGDLQSTGDFNDKEFELTKNYIEFKSIKGLDNFIKKSNDHEFLRELEAKLMNVGKYDLKIAAIALELGAVVVTRNVRDFARIPNLLVEDWSQPPGP